MSDTKTLKITFMDDKVVTLKFEPREGAENVAAGALENVLNLSVLPVIVDGTMVVYPFNNIRTIELTPVDLKNPAPYIIQNATLVE